MSQQQPPHGLGRAPVGYGAPPPPTPWYQAGVVVALSLLFCWPLGLILLWTSPKVSKNTRVIGTVVFGGIGLMVLISAATGKDKAPLPAPASEATPDAAPKIARRPPLEPTPKPAAARPMVSESCLELSQRFGTSSKLSDLQKEELWKAYAGKGFTWPLRITEVSSGVLSGFTVQAKCAPKSPSLIQDIQLSFDDDDKAFVMKLQKDEIYTLSGTLKTSSTLLGLTADGLSP